MIGRYVDDISGRSRREAYGRHGSIGRLLSTLEIFPLAEVPHLAIQKPKDLMMRIPLMVVIATLFTGCATTPVPLSKARQAPAERVLAFQDQPAANSASITVIRDEGFLGAACFYAVHINGTLAARLDVAESVRFFVPPGETLLRVGRDPLGLGLCGASQDNWTQRETIVKAGEHKAFRLSIDPNGKLDVQRTDM